MLGRVMHQPVSVGDGYFDSLTAGHYTIGSRHHWARMTASRLGGREWRDRRRGGARRIRIGSACFATNALLPISFFFRQWGQWAPALEERPAQAMVRVSKRVAGRLLDRHS